MKTTETDDIDLDAVMQSRRKKLLAERVTKQQELDGIDTQLRRIDGYLNPTGAALSKPRATGTRAPRGEPSDLQKRILAVIREYGAEGAKAASIIAELNATDVEEKQINAALFKMKKVGILNQAGRKQPYALGPNAPQGKSEEASNAHA